MGGNGVSGRGGRAARAEEVFDLEKLELRFEEIGVTI